MDHAQEFDETLLVCVLHELDEDPGMGLGGSGGTLRAMCQEHNARLVAWAALQAHVQPVHRYVEQDVDAASQDEMPACVAAFHRRESDNAMPGRVGRGAHVHAYALRDAVRPACTAVCVRGIKTRLALRRRRPVTPRSVEQVVARPG